MLVADGGGWYSPRVTNPPAPPPPRPTTTTPASPAGTTRVLPGATPERPLAGFIGPLSAEQEVLRSGPPPRIPRQVTLDNPVPRPNRFAGLEADDPRNDMLDTAAQLRTIDQQAEALANQPIDIEAAKARVQAAQENEKQFFAGVFAGLNRSQSRELGRLVGEIKRTPDNQQAIVKFDQALGAAMTQQQRAQLRTLQRETQKAQDNLEGQLIGQELRAAKARAATECTPEQKAAAAERVSLILAQARIHVSAVRQLEVNLKAQDAYELVMTPELQQKLSGPQKELADAARSLSADPDSEAAKQRFETAKAQYDAVFKATVNAYDQLALKNLGAIVQREGSLGQLLEEEAATQLRYLALHAEMEKMCFTGPRRAEYDIAKADYDQLQSNRTMRELALRAAADPQQSAQLLEDLAVGMMEQAKRDADTAVNRAQLDYDMAVRESQRRFDPANLPAIPNGGAPAAVAANGPVYGLPGVQQISAANSATFVAPAADPVVEEAKRRLDTAHKNRDDLYEMLKPPPAPPRSGWDRALEIGTGVLQVAGGLAIAAAFSWTGAGAVFGAAVAIDGAIRTVHSISDAVNGTTTDKPLSALLQKVPFVDRGAANRIDTGVSMLGLFGPGGVGAALTAVRSGSMLLKGVSAVSAVMIGDTLQAQGRYVVFNDVSTPGSVKLLTSMGMSELQANYVLLGATTVGVGGIGALAKGRAPIMSAQEAIARWHGKPVPERVHRSFDPLPGQQVKPGSSAAASSAAAASTATAASTSAAASGPAAVSTAATATSAPVATTAPVFEFDWYSYASNDVRLQAAEKMLGADASPKDLAKLTRKLKYGPLVVVRRGEEMVAAAALQVKSTGRLGVDGAHKVVKSHMAEIIKYGGDDFEAIRQVIAASANGARQFTSEQGIFWSAFDPDHSRLLFDQAKTLDDQPTLVMQRVTRDAPETLAAMPPDDIRPEVADALSNVTDGRFKKDQQLRNLAEILPTERGSWASGTQEFHYRLSFDRPPPMFGSAKLGKVFHLMHDWSYFGRGNHALNPVNWALKMLTEPVPNRSHHSGRLIDRLWSERLAPPLDWVRSGLQQKLQNTWIAPVRKVMDIPGYTFKSSKGVQIDAKAREAYVYRAGRLDDDTLKLLASHDLRDSGNLYGELWSVMRGVESGRLDLVRRALRGKDLILVFEDGKVAPDRTLSLTEQNNQRVLVGAAAVTRGFRGFLQQKPVQALPHLYGREQYSPGGWYLSDVMSIKPGGGPDATAAAEHFARNSGARYFDFLTQWEPAAKLYHKMMRVADPNKGDAIRLPDTKVYDARFIPGAAREFLKYSPEQLDSFKMPSAVREIVENNRNNPVALQAELEALGTNLSREHELYAAEALVPSGTLAVRYKTTYQWGDQSKLRQVYWGAQSGYWFARNYVYEKPKQLVLAIAQAPGIRDAARLALSGYHNFTPFGLKKDMQPGAFRGAMQDTWLSGRNALRHGWLAWRGAAVAATVPQVATGNAAITTNDDSTTMPFNGIRGSDSIAVYFKWTGTMITVWTYGPNARGPRGLDDNGLMPGARVSPPLTDPAGPKGAGFLAAARAALYEANLGVRWFGTNDGISAVSGASIRLLPANINLRGDVPVQEGALANLSLAASITAMMPSVSHGFYWGKHGVVIRNVHLTMAGSAQTAQLGYGSRWAVPYSGTGHTLGSKEVTVGTGLMYSPNPAYGLPNIDSSTWTPIRLWG